MLHGKDEQLEELYALCDTKEQRELVADLICRFNYFYEDVYNLSLIGIARYIKGLGYPNEQLVLCAITQDSEADSSQSVVNDIKVYVTEECGDDIVFCNNFNKINKYYKQGRRHFVAVDEFSGSGQTILTKQTEFNRYKWSDATLNFCMVAAMLPANTLAINNNIDLHVEYLMKQGIAGYEDEWALNQKYAEMNSLENKLAAKIKDTYLSDNRLGYGKAEALYVREGRNVPNNVFPIFWWKAYQDMRSRKTLFTRVQHGY